MRPIEPLDPEVEAALEAIDATLASEPVDPEHAELAELALLLRDDRPVTPPRLAASLDRRVSERFERPTPRRSWRFGRLVPRGWVGGAVTAVAAVAVAGLLVFGLTRGGGSGSQLSPFRATSGGAAAASSAPSGGKAAAASAGAATTGYALTSVPSASG